MRSILRFIAVAIVFSSAALLRAQSTNVVLTVTLNLTAYIQQPTNDSSVFKTTTTQKLATKDIVAAIAGDLGLSADPLTSKLLLIYNGVGDTTTNAVLNAVLRTSGGDTNINGIFSLDFPSGFSVLNNLSVTTERSNPNGTSQRLEYTIMSVSITTSNLSFQTQGQVKLNESSITSGRTIVDPRAFPTTYNSTITGPGTVGTNSAVFNGTFLAGSRKIEVTGP